MPKSRPKSRAPDVYAHTVAAKRNLNPAIQRQVDAVLAGESTEIKLSGYDFPAQAEVPQQISQLTTLRTLVIEGDKILSLPPWLADLPSLEFIDISASKISTLPESLPDASWGIDADQYRAFAGHIDPRKITELTIRPKSSGPVVRHAFGLSRDGEAGLSSLLIGGSILTDRTPAAIARQWRCLSLIDSKLDGFLARQQGLQELTIFGCPIRRFPTGIRQLCGLTSLTVGGVWAGEIPEWLFKIPGLAFLDLRHNDLSELPDTLGQATSIEHLYLDHNKFRHVPKAVWKLEGLKSLGISNCPIEDVPADILRLPRLASLELKSQGNRLPGELLVPPPEIAANGLDAIRRYWSQQQRDAGVDYLAEAKLLIVGEPGAGKTSLAKKILDPAYALDATEDSTEGIDILAWQFPAGVRVRPPGGEQLLKLGFRVNVWDFGGQEIYHSTHQFFLTKRSVYVLVTDERREDTDFEYWLEIVKLLSGGSPLLIVQNRKHGRQQAIDPGTLRQLYPNLCACLSLDLADNDGLDVAVTRIRRELEQLPHIGTALPATWQAVRRALEADKRNYMSAEDFFGVCAANGFTDLDDMRQLGGFLHDLGICLFFQDDALLSKTVILKPEWGTTAVYRVLDDPGVASAFGVFTADDLRRIWSDATYRSMHHELLQLMVKFQLCYPVRGKRKTYVAPQLLTSAKPAYDWDESGNLVLWYAYKVMPKGVVRRLIVALHDKIAPDHKVWRSGVVLEHGDSQAEVIEVYGRRTLTIRLRGSDPRSLLTLIEHELEVIHGSYEDIKFKKHLPCDCPTCSMLDDPTVFDVGDLKDFARTGHQIQCHKSREMREPADLLRLLLAELELPGLAPRRAPVEPIELPSAPAQPEVFVSYSWREESERLVDELQSWLAERGLLITRDKDTLHYRDSIGQFMDTMAAGSRIVVILSKAYLESENCMRELVRIAQHRELGELAGRIYPVVMPDAGIYDPLSLVGYIEYWEKKHAELAAAVKRIRPEHLEGIREKIDLYEDIRNTIAQIMETLADMNVLGVAPQGTSGFEPLYKQLAAELDR
jgi:Leucine-rich repeat (LRR) protein